MKLLHIDAGITGADSISRQLSAAVVNALVRANPALEVVHRDLEADPIPHLDGRSLAGLGENEILQEFLDADILVIGAPMYNFGMASQLKAWFDRILVAGKTFRYTDAGAVGLAGGKTVIVASVRGGVYAPGSPQAAMDFHEPHLKTLLGMVGIEDVTIIRAEGVALSPDHRATALQDALAAAPGVVDKLAAVVAA